MKYYIYHRLEDGTTGRGAAAMSRERCLAAMGPDPGFEYWLVPESQVDLENTRQAIAQVVHDGLWAHWMTYFFSVCQQNEDGSMTIPADKVARWQRQAHTRYSDLSPQEQASDLEQADKVLAALAGEAAA